MAPTFTSGPWGLTVPGRPPTPSEGHPQQYSRVGPREEQKLVSFPNGTCLEYGPNDPISEFDPDQHPFSNQIAHVDSAIKVIQVVRDRYQQRRATGSRTSVERDPFENFRVVPANGSQMRHISLESGVYLQVPSRHGTVTDMASVYSCPNKSDAIGLGHPVFSGQHAGSAVRGEARRRHGYEQGRPRRNRYRGARKPIPMYDGNDDEQTNDTIDCDYCGPNQPRGHTHRRPVPGRGGYHDSSHRGNFGSTSHVNHTNYPNHANTVHQDFASMNLSNMYPPQVPMPSNHPNNGSNGGMNHPNATRPTTMHNGYYHNPSYRNGGPSNQPNVFRPHNEVVGNYDGRGAGRGSRYNEVDPMPGHRNNPNNFNAGPANAPRGPRRMGNIGYQGNSRHFNAGPANRRDLGHPSGLRTHPPSGNMGYHRNIISGGIGSRNQLNGYQPGPGDIGYRGDPENNNANRGQQQSVAGPVAEGRNADIMLPLTSHQEPMMSRFGRMTRIQDLPEPAIGHATSTNPSPNSPVNNVVERGPVVEDHRESGTDGPSSTMERLPATFTQGSTEQLPRLQNDSNHPEASGPIRYADLPDWCTEEPPLSRSPESPEDPQGPLTPTDQDQVQSGFDGEEDVVNWDDYTPWNEQRTTAATQDSLTPTRVGRPMPQTPEATQEPEEGVFEGPEEFRDPEESEEDQENQGVPRGPAIRRTTSDSEGFWGPDGVLREIVPDQYGVPRGTLDQGGTVGAGRTVDEPPSMVNPDVSRHQSARMADFQRPMYPPLGYTQPPPPAGHGYNQPPPPPQGYWVGRPELGMFPYHPTIQPNHEMIVNQPYPPPPAPGYIQYHQPPPPPPFGYPLNYPGLIAGGRAQHDRPRGRLVLREPAGPARRVVLRSPIAFDPAGRYPQNMNMPFESAGSVVYQNVAPQPARGQVRPVEGAGDHPHQDMAPRATRVGRRPGALTSWTTRATRASSSADYNFADPHNTIFGEEPGMVSLPPSPTRQSGQSARGRGRRLFERSRVPSSGEGSSRAGGAASRVEQRSASSSDAPRRQ